MQRPLSEGLPCSRSLARCAGSPGREGGGASRSWDGLGAARRGPPSRHSVQVPERTSSVAAMSAPEVQIVPVRGQSWDAASRKVRMGVRAVHGFKVRMLSNANAQYSFPTNDHWIYYDCCGGLTRCVLQDVRAVNCVFETFTNEHLGIHLINSAHRH